MDWSSETAPACITHITLTCVQSIVVADMPTAASNHDVYWEDPGTRRLHGLVLWNTSGTDEFQCLRACAYFGTDVLVVCFDMTRVETLLRVERCICDLILDV